MFVSDGSLVTKTPVSWPQGNSYFPYMPPMATHGWPSAYAGIYSRQLWVYTVVSKLAKAAARLPLPVYERNDQDRPRADSHPMARLLANPNPGMSGFDLWLWTSSTFDIYGDTFWLKRRRAGQVVGLYPLHPSSIANDDGRWSFDNGKLRLDDIPDSDLISFRGFHPNSLTRGMSPLEPLRSTLENEWAARTATSSFWERGARPGTALSHPGTLSEGAAERLKKQYDQLGAGASNTGATIVLEEGMEPKTLTLTAEEAQYIETRKLNREEVCAAYDVPPPVVHILDRATFSNITEQMRSMYRDTMAPRLKGFEAAIEIGLRQAEWPDDEVYAEFLMDEVLRGDFETRQDALAKASHMTIAEKRKVENLPFIEGTDRIFLNGAVQPMAAPQSDEAPAAPPFQQVGLPALVTAGVISREDARQLLGITGPPPAVPDVPALPAPTARSVLGRLSWQKDLDQIDADALTDGLSDTARAAVTGALADERKAGGTVADLRERLRSMGRKDARGIRVKAPDLTDHQAQVRNMLAGFLARQGADVVGSGSFDSEKWDRELSDDLHATAVAVSGAIGKAAVRGLGYDPATYDVARTIDFLREVAGRLARNINLTTAEKFADADPEVVFGETRADGIAGGVTTLVGGFAVVEAGKRLAEAEGREPSKVWVTGPNPRATHAAMDGQRVPIDSTFSNGQDWPGSGGSAEETAGCNCRVEVEF